MKRDMDLVRQILLELEKLPFTGSWHDLSIEGQTVEDVVYHVRIMHEGGLIEAIELSDLSKVDWRPISITNEGHAFLDAARSDSIWSKAKEKVLGAAGPLTIEALKMAMQAVMKAHSGG